MAIILCMYIHAYIHTCIHVQLHYIIHPKVLYRYINSKQKNQSDITHLQKSDGTMTTSDVQVAEELNSFFKSTFTLEEPSYVPTIPSRISGTLSNIDLSEEPIFSKLLLLRPLAQMYYILIFLNHVPQH